MDKKKKTFLFLSILLLITVLLMYFSFPYLKGIFKGNKNNSVQSHSLSHQEETNIPQGSSEAEEDVPMIEISPEKQQLIGIKTEIAGVKSLQKSIYTIGRIEYDERRLFTINTKFEGWIEKLYVDYTGKYIKIGDPLAEIYSPELYATQLEFINLIKWGEAINKGKGVDKTELDKMLAKDAESIINAAKDRLRLWDITEEQIKKIEETRQPIRNLIIYSPVNGYVIQRMALKGMRVMPGEKLFDIADLSNLWIIADIYEFDIPMIKVGQSAKISLSYFPGKVFSSTIDYVYPAISPDTRTAKVRFSLPNIEGHFKPQMFTNVEIKLDLGKRLVISEDAIIDTGIRQIVYVDIGNGYFEPRQVITGLRADGMVEVIKGLKEGEKVASSANFLIDSEAQLRGVKPLHIH